MDNYSNSGSEDLGSTGTTGTTATYTESNGNGNGSSGTDGIKEQAQQAVHQAKERAGEMAGQAKERAGEMAGQAQNQIKMQLSEQKNRAAESIDQFAQSLLQTGQCVEGQSPLPLSGFAVSAASQVEQLSSYLRENDVDDIVRDAGNFAKNQPALFLGGMFALGFVVSRLLKNSMPPPAPDYSRNYGGDTFEGTTNYENSVNYDNSTYAGGAYDMAAFQGGTSGVPITGSDLSTGGTGSTTGNFSSDVTPDVRVGSDTALNSGVDSGPETTYGT